MPENCNHKDMKEYKKDGGVVSICPDCGLREVAPTEEVDRVSKEILDDIEKNEK